MKQATWKIADRLNVSWHRMSIDHARFLTNDRIKIVGLFIDGCVNPMVRLHNAVYESIQLTIGEPED